MAKDPLMQMLDRKGGGSFDGVDQAGKELWKFRVELGYLTVISTAFGGLYLASHRNTATAGAVLGAALIVLLFVRPLRRRVRTSLGSAQVRRRWDKATKHCSFPHPIPISKVESISIGHRARVRVGRGVSFVDLASRAERLAATLGVRELRVERDPHNASTGTVILVKANPLIRAESRWPGLAHTTSTATLLAGRIVRSRRTTPVHYGEEVSGEIVNHTSLWDPIPIGTNEHGERIEISLPGKMTLIGGQSGSGKSSLMDLLIAAAVLDPSVIVHGIDAKAVELGKWKRLTESYSVTQDDAAYQLEYIERNVIQVRYREMEAAGEYEFDRRTPLHLIFVDELSTFTTSEGKAKFSDTLRKILAMGRACGVGVVAASQKPEDRVVPSSLRDLFQYRIAFGVRAWQWSDVILGAGMAQQGFDASKIATHERGRAYLLTEGLQPQLMQAYYLEKPDIAEVIERAAQVRGVTNAAR